MTEVSSIQHINAELTRACNLRCDYCFNDSEKVMSGELSTQEWKTAINIAKGYGAKSSLFTGGEITARKNFSEIINHSLEQELRTSILSNGFRIREYGENIRMLERVQISLDSASPYTHDARRGEGSWKIARSAIDYVRERGVPVEISSVISEDRVNELEGLAGIVYLTGSKILVRPMQSIGRASTNMPKNLNRLIANKKEDIEKRFANRDKFCGNIFVNDFAMYVPILGATHDKTVIPQGYITILPDGIIRGTNQNILGIHMAA